MASRTSDKTEKKAAPEFCPDCGCVLSLAAAPNDAFVTCSRCNKKLDLERFAGVVSNIRIVFNDKEELKKIYESSKKKKKQESNDHGPVVDMECRKCGHGQMTYATLQTRSADEGQTVFYTCIKCGFQFNENS